MFAVKGSTSKRSWLVYNPCLTAIYYTIKCEDDMHLLTAAQIRKFDFPLKRKSELYFKL